MKLSVMFTIILILGLSSLAACGVRPSTMEKPADKQDRIYPKVYPHPETLDK